MPFLNIKAPYDYSSNISFFWNVTQSELFPLSASFLFELSDSPLIVLLFDTELMTMAFRFPDNIKAFHCSMAAHASLLSLNYSFKPM